MNAGDRVTLGRLRTGELVAWAHNGPALAQGDRVVLGQTVHGNLVAWPYSTAPVASESRVVIGRTATGALVAWAMGKAFSQCPDVGTLNPTDRSENFEDTISVPDFVDVGALPIELPSIPPNDPPYFYLAFDRAMCISNLYMRIEWVTPQTAGNGAILRYSAGGGIGTFDISLLLSNHTDDDTAIASAGDFEEVNIPGVVAYVMPGDRVIFTVSELDDHTSTDGVVAVTIRYTAVEFDQEYH